MDNVVDRALFPLPEQEAEAKSKRRMGLGVTGLANCLEAQGYAYGSPEFLAEEARVLHFINRRLYLASVGLAQEKGSFPLFDRDLFCQGEFVRTLDQDVQDLIFKHGIRNSHLSSIAPTGTISMAADNVSSSIEPVYRWQQERTVLMAGGRQTVDLFDYGFGHLNVRGKRTSMGEVTAEEHVRVLTTAQAHVDSAVSKTINCDGSMPWTDFCGVYDMAYEGGAKGCTTFNKDGKRMGLFKETPEPADLPFPGANSLAMVGFHTDQREGPTCEVDFATGRRSCE
jgi:ribonucleoside-diphosphate reductase alpha chain